MNQFKVRTAPNRIRIAARQSDLAKIQAYEFGRELGKAHPSLAVEYAFRESLGDRNQEDPLWRMPEKGVFTEDFIKDLESEAAEFVVHSWKDLPTEPRPTTSVVATLPRSDARDLLLFRKDRIEIARARTGGAVRILTSSPRRAHNLGGFLRSHLPFPIHNLEFVPVRGNIPTRLRKMMADEVEGIIVAKAAIDRLLSSDRGELAPVQKQIRTALDACKWMVLPLSVNPAAPAQGALAIEISSARSDLAELAKKISCAETFACAERERKILAGYGGGCHQKIGATVIRRPYGDVTFVRGVTDAGEVLDRVALEPAEKYTSPMNIPENALFPRRDEEAGFFARAALAKSEWLWAETQKFLWVARESAWPNEFIERDDAVIWTAGLESWRKLARRGVWVTGSAEGLGEEEATRLETLVGSDIAWNRLSHIESDANDSGMRVCPTYRLVPRGNIPNLSDRTHFYWGSSSAFDLALRLYPAIRGKYHACGPGKTARRLRSILGSKGCLEVYLDKDSWRRRLSGRGS